MEFVAPNNSKAHLSLREIAKQDGLDVSDLRDLLWLINAHPDLVSHARVFDNLRHLLGEIANYGVGNESTWLSAVPSWIKICEWACTKAEQITKLEGLEDFDKKSRDEKLHHPLNRAGFSRHGVISALWNRHESVIRNPQFTYPPIPNTPAWRYFRLQARLLYSYMDISHQISMRDGYEKHSDEKELLDENLQSNSAGRAVRELNKIKHENILIELGLDKESSDFYINIKDVKSNYRNITDINERNKIEQYIEYLKRYFETCLHPKIRKKGKNRSDQSGSSQSKGPVTGFIGLGHGLLQDKHQQSDEDSFELQRAIFLVPSDPTEKIDPKELERSGLCPQEDFEPILELVDANEYANKMFGAYRGQRAREMSAQSYGWDWNKLTLGETKTLWAQLEKKIAQAYCSPSNKSVARYLHISALIIKFMLVFGQSLEQARSLRFEQIKDKDKFDEQGPHAIDQPTLFIFNEIDPEKSNDLIIKFGLPSLSPDYKSEKNDELNKFSRRKAGAIMLADLSDLGKQILEFLHSEGLTLNNQTSFKSDKVFKVDYKTVEDYCKEIFDNLDSRLTLARINRMMPSVLTQQSGDPSLAWVTFCMQERRNEPRLHYTMHACARIEQAYVKAANYLLSSIGQHPKCVESFYSNCDFKFGSKFGSNVDIDSDINSDSNSQRHPESTPKDVHIGCRFVFAKHHLESLICDLKRKLKDRNLNTSNVEQVRQYHQDFLFYTYLILTITTCIRATNNPVSLFMQWLEADRPMQGGSAFLSDKETMFFNKSRLIVIPPILAQQFYNFQVHIEWLKPHMEPQTDWHAIPVKDQLFLTFEDPKRSAHSQYLTKGWIEAQFTHHLGMAIPANFSRAFMRTELLERSVQAEIVDAFLGHFNEGESSFAPMSTFDYERYTQTLKQSIDAVVSDLKLEAIQSRFVPFNHRRYRNEFNL